MFESVAGLPAHPLFVHAPAVLIPLSTLLALAAVVLPQLRGRAGLALTASAIVCLVTTQMAIASGNEFDELVAGIVNTDHHEELGLMTRNFLILFFLASVATAVLERRSGDSAPSWLGRAILGSTAVTAIGGLLATVWVIRTGHEGARLVWDGVLMATLQ